MAPLARTKSIPNRRRGLRRLIGEFFRENSRYIRGADSLTRRSTRPPYYLSSTPCASSQRNPFPVVEVTFPRDSHDQIVVALFLQDATHSRSHDTTLPRPRKCTSWLGPLIEANRYSNRPGDPFLSLFNTSFASDTPAATGCSCCGSMT